MKLRVTIEIPLNEATMKDTSATAQAIAESLVVSQSGSSLDQIEIYRPPIENLDDEQYVLDQPTNVQIEII